MPWKQDAPLSFEAGGRRLEGWCFGPPPGEAPTLVLLHEGLEGLASWGDFPGQVAAAAGWGVFAWSRAGFGGSEPSGQPPGLARLEHEALEVLPEVLERLGFERGVLMGHGEGAALASLYAGSVEDHRVRGLILESPRFFLEGPAPEAGPEHWRRTWLAPESATWNIEEVIDYLRIPVLAIQGADDPYGTRAQLQALDTRTYSPVDLVVLEGCGHDPHREKPAETLAAVVDYLGHLSRMEEAKIER